MSETVDFPDGEHVVTSVSSISMRTFGTSARLMQEFDGKPDGYEVRIGRIIGALRDVGSAVSKFPAQDGSPVKQHVLKGAFRAYAMLPGMGDEPIVSGVCHLPGAYADMAVAAFKTLQQPGEELTVACEVIAVKASGNAIPWRYKVDAIVTERTDPTLALERRLGGKLASLSGRRLAAPQTIDGSAVEVAAIDAPHAERKRAR